MFIVKNSFSDMYPTSGTRFQPFFNFFQPTIQTKKKKIFLPQMNFFGDGGEVGEEN